MKNGPGKTFGFGDGDYLSPKRLPGAVLVCTIVACAMYLLFIADRWIDKFLNWMDVPAP